MDSGNGVNGKMDCESSLEKILHTVLRHAVSVVASLFVLTFVVLAVVRIQYPFELEWMEGATVDHVARLLSGKTLYCEPSLDFTPFRYGPFYYYISALLGLIFGSGFLPLRLVSFCSTLGCMVLLYKFVKRETSCWQYGLVSVGFFAATYPASGTWFDVGRVDMLFLFLLLAGLYLLRFSDSPREVAMAGLFSALAVLTKQVAVLVLIPVGIWFLVTDRRMAVLFGCVVALVVVGGGLILDKIYGGWFCFYVFSMGQHIAYAGGLMERLWSFLVVLVWKPFPIASLLSITCLIFYGWSRDYAKRRFFYVALLVGMMGAAFLLWINAGSYYNNLLPGHVILSLMCGLGLGAIGSIRSHAGVAGRVLLPMALLACLWQFGMMRYDPQKHLPSDTDRRAGYAFLDKIAAIDGEVMVAFHGHVPTLAGKRTHANRMAITDVLNRSKGEPRMKLKNEIKAALKDQRFGALVLDHTWFEDMWKEHYVEADSVFASPDVFWPVTGWRIRPERICVPIDQDDGQGLPRVAPEDVN